MDDFYPLHTYFYEVKDLLNKKMYQKMIKAIIIQKEFFKCKNYFKLEYCFYQGHILNRILETIRMLIVDFQGQ